MTGTVLILAGFLVAVSAICGILAAFIAHGYLWDRIPPAVAATGSGVAGCVVCAGMVFGFLWALNPDPPERGQRSAAAAATMTGVSAVLWLPLYLYAFTAVARRHRRGQREGDGRRREM